MKRKPAARKPVEAALRESEQRLRIALKAASMITWQWDIPTATVSYSLNTTEFFGGNDIKPYCSIESLLQLIHPEDRATLTQAIHRTKSKGAPFDCEYRAKMLDGAYHWIAGKGDVVERRAGKPVRAVGVSQDITARKGIEEALLRSQERMRLFFERQVVGMAITSPEQRWLQVNNRVCRMLGYSRSELLKLTWAELTHPDDLATDLAYFKRVQAGKIDSYSMEKRFIRKNGQVIWTNLSVVCVRRPDHSLDYFVGIIEDITDRRKSRESLEQANASLRRLAHRITQVEESERRRLAYVLHEDLQQQLVSALFLVSDIRQKTVDPSALEQLGKLSGTLDQCINLTRTTTYATYPPALHDLGIGSALGWLAQYCQKNLGLSVHLRVDQHLEVEPEEPRICLFRAAQELLLNVAKHAKVKSATLRLTREKSGRVRLQVSDKGLGFDPTALPASHDKQQGFGLFSLRERAELLGGRLKIQSHPGTGTLVSLWMPAHP